MSVSASDIKSFYKIIYKVFGTQNLPKLSQNVPEGPREAVFWDDAERTSWRRVMAV